MKDLKDLKDIIESEDFKKAITDAIDNGDDYVYNEGGGYSIYDKSEAFKEVMKAIKTHLGIKTVKNLSEYDFDKNDWYHFHDVILDATYDNEGGVDLKQEEMEELFKELPDYMKLEANEHGMNDTVWRDNLWVWYRTNKMD